MPVGGYYLEVEGAEELKRALEGTARGIKDLSKAHREIGKMAALYVIRNEPMSSGGNAYAGHNRGTTDGYLQMHTKGGGGKYGAYVEAQAPYLYVQEFGGTSFWTRQIAAGVLRKANRAHRSYEAMGLGGSAGKAGHVIYKKPRNPRGYFIWNVAFRLRSRIGKQYMEALQEIAARNQLTLDVVSHVLDIPLEPPPTGRG